MNKFPDYVVGNTYRYSEIPEETTNDVEVNDYGEEYLGKNAIHVRYHKNETDIWFIWVGMANEGIFKCVYKN